MGSGEPRQRARGREARLRRVRRRAVPLRPRRRRPRARRRFPRRGPGACATRATSPRAGGPEQADAMNRLYAVESMPTSTGSRADHRLPLRAERHRGGRAADRGGRRRGRRRFGSPRRPAARRTGAAWIAAVAKDLLAHRGASLVIAGDGQPATVHALAHAMNAALGNAGTTVVYTDPVEAEPADQLQSLRDLAADMNAGTVDAPRHPRRQSRLHRAGRSAVRRRDEQSRSSAFISVSTTMRRRRCVIGRFPRRTSSKRGATHAATTAPSRSCSRSSRRSTAASRRTSCSRR